METPTPLRGRFFALGLALAIVVGYLAFRDDWPSFSKTWDLPFGTLTDVVSIVLGVVVLSLTIYVAFMQLKIMRDQTAMMKEQGRIALEQAEGSKRQEAIAIRQEAMTKRQGEIAESQHQIMKAQLAKQANPYVYLGGLARGIRTPEGWSPLALNVRNKGSRTLRDYHWTLYIPFADKGNVQLTADKGTVSDTLAMLPPPHPIAVGEYQKYLYVRMTGFESTPLHPDQTLPLASIQLNRSVETFAITVLWEIDSEDGHFPEGGGQALVSGSAEF